jgi:hypothetical protein
MDRDCGWVELLPLDGETASGRGRLLISDSPDQAGVQAAQVLQPSADSPNEPASSEWTGRIEALRADTELVPDQRYRLRFELNDEVRQVLLEAVDAAEGEGTAWVRSCDGQLPAVWVELGGH